MNADLTIETMVRSSVESPSSVEMTAEAKEQKEILPERNRRSKIPHYANANFAARVEDAMERLKRRENPEAIRREHGRVVLEEALYRRGIRSRK